MAAQLGHADAGAVPRERSFRDLGLGSLAIVELADRLSEVLGRPVDATEAFDFPTPAALAAAPGGGGGR